MFQLHFTAITSKADLTLDSGGREFSQTMTVCIFELCELLQFAQIFGITLPVPPQSHHIIDSNFGSDQGPKNICRRFILAGNH